MEFEGTASGGCGYESWLKAGVARGIDSHRLERGKGCRACKKNGRERSSRCLVRSLIVMATLTFITVQCRVESPRRGRKDTPNLRTIPKARHSDACLKGKPRVFPSPLNLGFDSKGGGANSAHKTDNAR